MSREPTIRQQKFVGYYLESGNATEALVKAGFRTKYPTKYAHEILNKPHIKALLDKTRCELNSNTKLTYDFKIDVLLKGINYYVSTSDYDKASKLIEVSNKMQGHNAPEKTISAVSVNDDFELVKELTEKYLHDIRNK